MRAVRSGVTGGRQSCQRDVRHAVAPEGSVETRLLPSFLALWKPELLGERL
jgi:hypothetical protein